jgi:hypothetical protein
MSSVRSAGLPDAAQVVALVEDRERADAAPVLTVLGFAAVLPLPNNFKAR